MDRLYFGTAGIPLSTEKGGTPEGIARVRELNLDAMELEFVRGVRLREESAILVRKAAVENDVILTAHGPYYINLASERDEVRSRSMERIMNTARIANLCGARSITFHAGYYFKGDAERTYGIIGKALRNIVSELSDEGNRVRVCPEVMGKVKSFGKLPEIIGLCEEVGDIHPCIDFAHLHALKGNINTYEEFAMVLEEIESRLGRDELANMHVHISGIEYGERGERRHRDLGDSDMNYRDLLKVFADFDCAGVVICESPSIEGDASLLRQVYQKIKEV